MKVAAAMSRSLSTRSAPGQVFRSQNRIVEREIVYDKRRRTRVPDGMQLADRVGHGDDTARSERLTFMGH